MTDKSPKLLILFERRCIGCKILLSEPYIKCADCIKIKTFLCLGCFCKGHESGRHANDHSYQIITNNFSVMESGWDALEEMKLLDGLSDCGPGNWDAIAAQIATKTKQQCASHYMKFYVVNAKYPLPEMAKPILRPTCQAIPFKACEDPCRPLPDSHRAQHMAGYLAARGDFVEEFDNYAEWGISDIYFSKNDWPVLKALKFAVVNIYQAKLKERERRKQIIKNCGLINQTNHTLLYIRKLSHEIQEIEVKFRPLMQLQTHSIAHDKLVNSLGLEKQLQKRVMKLRNYRKNGIRSYRAAHMYDKLQKQREQTRPKINFMSEILPHLHDPIALTQWLHRQVEYENNDNMPQNNPPITTSMRKYSAPPIDLTGLPGVEKLSSKEKEFCAVNRLIPEAFLTHKNALINEYRKSGTIRLATARLAVKIDVNKTRKLFDFLLEQGDIEQK